MIRDLWDSTEKSIIYYWSYREEKMGHEKMFEEIMVKINSNLMKDIILQMKKYKQTRSRINTRKITHSHTLCAENQT